MIQKQGRISDPWSAKAQTFLLHLTFSVLQDTHVVHFPLEPSPSCTYQTLVRNGWWEGVWSGRSSGEKEADWVLQPTSRWKSFLPKTLSKAKRNKSESSTNLWIYLYSLRIYKPEHKYWRILGYSTKIFLG